MNRLLSRLCAATAFAVVAYGAFTATQANADTPTTTTTTNCAFESVISYLGSPLRPGGFVDVDVQVVSPQQTCEATTVTVSGGGRILGTAQLTDGIGDVDAQFNAFVGLSKVTAALDTGQVRTVAVLRVVPRPTPKTAAKAKKPTKHRHAKHRVG